MWMGLTLMSIALGAPELGLDVETDPLNWALGGGSLHAGVRIDRTRLGIGTFSLQEPTLFHGNEDIRLFQSFTALRVGYGFGPRKRGFHVDVVAEHARAEVEERGSDRVGIGRYGVAGVEVGGRIPIVSGLYLHPWAVGGVRIGPGRITAGEATHDLPRIVVLPILHLGWNTSLLGDEKPRRGGDAEP